MQEGHVDLVAGPVERDRDQGDVADARGAVTRGGECVADGQTSAEIEVDEGHEQARRVLGTEELDVRLVEHSRQVHEELEVHADLEPSAAHRPVDARVVEVEVVAEGPGLGRDEGHGEVAVAAREVVAVAALGGPGARYRQHSDQAAGGKNAVRHPHAEQLATSHLGTSLSWIGGRWRRSQRSRRPPRTTSPSSAARVDRRVVSNGLWS